MRKLAHRALTLAICTTALIACSPPPLPAGETRGSETSGDGDGDGEPATTTGDGDGEPASTTGDGDGEPATTTGDGDGEPAPLPCDRCDGFDFGCHEGLCDDPLASGNCGIDFCDALDGTPELLLELTAHHFPIPPGIFVGANLRVTAHHDYGGDAYVKAFDTVRSLDDGQLIAANRVGNSDPAIEGLLGETFAELYDPFELIEFEELYECEAVPVGENCDLVDQFIRVDHSDGPVTLLRNNSVGYAEGGYGVVVSHAETDQGFGCSGETAPYPQAYLVRVDCEGDECPAPTYADGCVGEDAPDPRDAMAVHPSGWLWFPYEAWEFECVVVEINELELVPEGVTMLRIPLDCLNVKASSYYP